MSEAIEPPEVDDALEDCYFCGHTMLRSDMTEVPFPGGGFRYWCGDFRCEVKYDIWDRADEAHDRYVSDRM